MDTDNILREWVMHNWKIHRAKYTGEMIKVLVTTVAKHVNLIFQVIMFAISRIGRCVDRECEQVCDKYGFGVDIFVPILCHQLTKTGHIRGYVAIMNSYHPTDIIILVCCNLSPFTHSERLRI